MSDFDICHEFFNSIENTVNLQKINDKQISSELSTQLEKFVNEAHSYGLKTALAGSVKKEQLKPLNDIGCDVVGIRGAACVGGDRNTGKIHHTAVAELKELCDSFQIGVVF